VAAGCCGGSGETLIFTCAGAAHSRQVANRVGVSLMQEGKGGLFRIAAVGAGIPDKMERARMAGKRVVIDACEDHCIRKIMEKAGGAAGGPACGCDGAGHREEAGRTASRAAYQTRRGARCRSTELGDGRLLMQLRVAAPAEVTRYAYVTFDALLILILLPGTVVLARASAEVLKRQGRATHAKEHRHD
jgi:hypothetical protein